MLLAFLFIINQNVYGTTMTQIKICPDKPNCVSSLDTTEYAKIEPLALVGTAGEAKIKLTKIMKKLSRTKLEKDESNYLHFTSKSFLFRFIDDIEFEIDEAGKKIHVRSASRTGHSDFGVNRKRIEEIRGLW